ncbi:tRNA (5-methylaminomethyl-2-thiouridine)(34)-methyltransferase MnmD [Kordiimonas sp. SCSIO 12610]|uniref:tRNA (5-methylaminomethyl-2-thiouridine)(34)-methyltransferase MnmD n=1 Tax=Kordiimonas sp. SCSIO 12610 TaxID=2829597 RepID=UPI00210A55EB|nr:tRNA (5-methylaminomethyl-2-thiouridine)(34)-methyltransferase MnmD [Kordiimonas sp. SCSIO 12610]UTW56739.1 tRNA (5-methylaminomethyl-2-thiouridine)(34)-methyltransferase MnmD [Kordiimonas sp. SCSIO 12610]
MNNNEKQEAIRPLNENDLEWRDGTPIAKAYDDIYFSVDNGLEESRFVFLEGIGAPDVWCNQPRYVIAETGFGTGLNFLTTWKSWRESNASGRLTFISVEAMPLSRTALKNAHKCFPELEDISDQLIDSWPPPENGHHVRHFDDGHITLILIFGKADSALSHLDAKVDAWYLDGFAPAKNPDMWNDTVFDNVARLSRQGAKLATFTAAGFVKRGLADRGFEMRKTPGYGRKRERLVGEYYGPSDLKPNIHRKLLPDWALPPLAKPDGSIAVIGGGIAGSMIAYALKSRTRNVTVFKSPEEKTASSIPAAIMAPRINREIGPLRSFQVSAYAYALSHPVLKTHMYGDDRLDYLAFDAQELQRNRKLYETIKWGDDWASLTDDILTFKRASTIDTQSLLNELLDQIPVINTHIEQIIPSASKWKVCDHTGKQFDFDLVILATGQNTPHHAALSPNCYTFSAGQVEILEAEGLDLPNHILSYGDHISACCKTDKYGDIRVLGSSFEKLSELPTKEANPSKAISNILLDNLKLHLNIDIADAAHLSSWNGIRTNTPDFLPIVGGVPNWEKCDAQYALLKKDALTRGLGSPTYQDGLYLITGFGSKGYQYAPLLSEYLAAQICGEPTPLSYDLWRYLSPYRFNARALIRE